MPAYPDRNVSSPSTTWAWRCVKIKPAPQGSIRAERSESTRTKLWRRDARRPLTLTISYRSGPEATWLIEARGRRWFIPGHLCVHDVFTEVCREQWGGPKAVPLDGGISDTTDKG